MANYNNNANSLINGLSDFWLLYFKEIDQIEELYSGTEVLLGQGYLDLMALLLNNSIQDTTIFNKEYFKLIRIKETDIKFRQTTTVSSGRYSYSLPDNMVYVRHLNNKIFNPTLSLDNDVEYLLNSDVRSLLFSFDPLNAYLEDTYGVGDSEFRLRSLLRNPDGAVLRVWLNDTGGPLLVAVSGYDITINYDGPANTGTTRTLDIIQAVNTQLLASQLVVATLSGPSSGAASPAGTPGLTPLYKTDYNPLDNVATRNVEIPFAGAFTVPTVTNWISTAVEKGDILRLLGSPTVGKSEDIEINLIRQNTLYVGANATVTTKSGAQQDFAVLRRTSENLSDQEPLGLVGQIVQSNTDGVVTGATRTLVAPSAVFYSVHKGDLVEIQGTLNVGYFYILEVIDSSTVVLAASSLVDESLVTWNLISTVSSSNVNTDGALTDNGDQTITFNAVSASFGTDVAGTVLKVYTAGILKTYAIRQQINSTTLLLDGTTVNSVGVTWGWATFKPPTVVVAYSPPIAWIDTAEVTVTGRRLLDNRAVAEGIDYLFSRDTGTLTALTVWQPSISNTITYRYLTTIVENVTPVQSSTDGVITAGSPATFTAATALFTQDHVGFAITIQNSGLSGITNNGVHYIKDVLSSTTVQLTDFKYVPAAADPNNGALTWALNKRGSFTKDKIATAYESAYWCPDILVDRFHLYTTFGYLINRFERSSEEYRSLIRGIFQLFMLGPTLERFESAINTVAGLPVIRDTGEILVSYTTGAEASGTDGILTGTTNRFTSTTAAFTLSDGAKYIYIGSGFNANSLFKILSVIDANTVVLETTPITDAAVLWELSTTNQQIVQTSRASYAFERRVPLLSSVTDPANIGIKIFRAFEVLTDVFRVTDYLETPQWWDLIQIPAELMPGQTGFRRQSSPVLFENVLNPADDARIGDPGLYVGADSDGVVPAVSLVRAGLGPGYLTGDPLYPFSNNVYFDAAAGAFTNSDVGNLLAIGTSTFLIQQRISTTRIKIQSFLPVVNGAVASWNVLTGTLPKRHKAAFVILDKLLKYHLFQVYFDLTLLNVLNSNILVDLQELVFVAKPSYTYIAVTPAALFQERINVEEDFDERPVVYPGGSEGMIVAANENPLVVIGASWRVGTWFRYLDAASTFAAPAAAVTDALGVAPAGYAYYLNKAYIEPADFTNSGSPIQVASLIQFTGIATAGASIVCTADLARLTVTTPGSFSDFDILQYVTLSGSGLSNDGTYRIAAIVSDTEVDLYAPGAADEAGLSWAFTASGSGMGAVSVNPQGLIYFTDYSGRADFKPANIGDYIRRPYVTSLTNQAFRINEVESSITVICAEEHRVHPVAADPDVEVSVLAGTLTVINPGDLIFSMNMCQQDRETSDFATSLSDRFYVEFSTGANAGSRFYIQKYVDASTVELKTAPTNTASDLCHVGVIRSPAAVNELSSWELVREQIVLDTNTIQLPSIAIQDINPTVAYTAYGVQEPIDPTVSVFDDTAGDTYYHIGMPDPRQHRGKSRTGRDTDMREEPLQITRTP